MEKKGSKKAVIFYMCAALGFALYLIWGIYNCHEALNQFDLTVCAVVGFMCAMFLFMGISELERLNEDIKNIESKPDRILNDLRELITKHE